MSVARCEYNPEDIDGEPDAMAVLSETEKPDYIYTKEFVLGAEAAYGTDYY